MAAGSALRLRGRILRERGRLDDAEHVLQRSLELDPAFPETRLELARLRLAQGRPADARQALETALQAWSEADAAYVRGNEARQLLRSLRGGR